MTSYENTLSATTAAALLAARRTVTKAERAYTGPDAVDCVCGSRAPHDHE